MDTMHHSYRSVWFLIIGISAISGSAWFANTYTPDSWQKVVIFFIFAAAIILSLLLYILNNVRHVLLITGGLLILLFLRLLGLREIIYPLLLLACLVSVELMLRKR